MPRRFNFRRSGRLRATFAWIAALGALAWVIADTALLFATPASVPARLELTTDPVAAARDLGANPPMALAGSGHASGKPGPALSWSLTGYATGFGRDRGFALLRSAEGATIAATEGETIEPGVTVARIHRGGVDITRAGITETLETVQRDTATARIPAPIKSR